MLVSLTVSVGDLEFYTGLTSCIGWECQREWQANLM